MQADLEGKKIVLFDGVCNLCDKTVQKIIANDKKDVFRFASIQSEFGQKMLTVRGIDPQKMDSVILIEPGVAYYQKSTAALNIAKELGGGYRFLSYFSFLPESLRDSVYDFVANNRYRWYGKKDHCMIPTPELKSKFLD